MLWTSVLMDRNYTAIRNELQERSEGTPQRIQKLNPPPDDQFAAWNNTASGVFCVLHFA